MHLGVDRRLVGRRRVGKVWRPRSLRYLHVNDTLARFINRTPDDFIGKTVREVAPHAAEWVEPVMRRIFETGEPVLNLEVSGTIPDERGRTRQWLISFVPAQSEGGATNAVSVLVLDITDWRELERTLSESEGRLAMLAEHSSDAVLVFDEGGRFLEVNPRLYRMLGYTREELSGMRVQDLIPDEDLAADPIAHAELHAGKTVRRRRRLRRKDGSHVAVEVVSSMIGEGRMQSIVRELPSEASGEVAQAERGSAGGRVIEQPRAVPLPEAATACYCQYRQPSRKSDTSGTMGEAVQPAPAARRIHDERRRSEDTVLYQLVQEHLETFLAQVAGVPRYAACCTCAPDAD